jgi:hypothetical protein
MKGDVSTKRGVFGPSILYLKSTLNTESEYIHIDYDFTRHMFGTIANYFYNIEKI